MIDTDEECVQDEGSRLQRAFPAKDYDHAKPLLCRHAPDGKLEFEHPVAALTSHAESKTGGVWVVRPDDTVLLNSRGEIQERVAMIDPVRQDILQQLQRVSELAPELRFGQLVANLAFLAAGPWDQTLWNLEDDQLLSAIQQLRTDLERRQERVA
ncbi:MAG: hypothetical protein L0Y71_24450 [Gemmataceae bacterium]|nr:hypothetical protein [Gemmataceae bacterium]